MKKHFEGILSELGRRKSRRRRMTALLLVLSLFVTSGVSWALHGVGLTMANEAECGSAEHVHTDACYQRTLICGLETDKTHTHTDACYDEELICGMAEHVHDVSCYTGETVQPDTAAGQADETGDAEDYIEYAEAYDAGFRIMADGDDPGVTDDPGGEEEEDNELKTISTVDNIAEGIKFTLFDYGDSNLESQNNNYGFRSHWDNDANRFVADGPPYYHDNVSTSGINEGRYPDQDIMFFAYGTPVPDGVSDEYCHNYIQDGVQYYLPDMNSYAGDYNATPVYPGNRPVSGIVKSTLGADGYPELTISGHSLAYLFNPSADYDGENKRVTYTDVNHLLQKQTSKNGVDHLVYNSDKNYAYFNTDTKEFDVYNRTYEIINDNHHYKDDVNNIKFDENEQPIKYTEEKDPGFKIGFFPFDAYNEDRKDPNYDGNGFNHHFGMTMEASFSNLPVDGENVKEPITFKYSGDDDMWVFVDGKLVLDIGGIHEPAGGMIDFSNDLVWIQDNGNAGISLDGVKTQLMNKGVIHSDAEWNALPKPIGIDTSHDSSGTTGNKWIVTPISDYISNWDDIKYGNHDIKMFYLERGGCYSNLAMEMNLPTLKPLTIKKDVDYQDHVVKDPAIDNMDYTFEIWEFIVDNEETGDGHWTEPDDIPHTVTLKAGERETFENLAQSRKFKITEAGVDPNIFDQVKINGNVTDLTGLSAQTDVSLGSAVPLSQINAYNFENRVIQDTTEITVKKEWDCDENKKPADYTIKYKIMRSDSASDEYRQIAVRYEDPENPGKIKKRRTFALPPDKQLEGETITGLLSRYGNHVYSYTVEELNVPDGFKPMYNYSTPGVLKIINTDITNVDIYMEKAWENQPDPMPEIELELKRKKTGYSGSQKTSVKVNMLDEAGNLITSYVTHDVYAGGSAELPYYWPDGVELYHYEGIVLDENSTVDTAYPDNYPQKSPDSLGAKFETDEGVLVVTNLNAKNNPNDPDEIANVVSFKVRTDNAADSLLLEHHSFTRGTNGWDVQNDMSKQSSPATVKYDGGTGVSYAKGDALIVQNRTKAFNGAMLYLDPAKFRGNKTYTFTTYVYSPVADRFKMTFNNGLGNFQPISNYVSVPAGEWTKITGTVKLTDTIDPYNMFILVESEPTTINDDTEACLGSEFRIDEFIAVEGNNPVEVTSGSGVVTVESDRTVYSIQFNDTFGTWQKRGAGVTMTSGHDTQNGFDFMIVDGRNASYEGVMMPVPFLEKGHTYRFESFVQGNGSNFINNVTLSIDTINGNGDISQWQNIGSAAVNSNNNTYQGNTITGTFEIKDHVDQENMYLYYEAQGVTQNNVTRYGPFRIHNLTITDVTDPYTPPPKAGYTTTDGNYVSNYSLYYIELDENSVTNPLHLDRETETVETVQTITMNASPWSFHWDKEALNEQPGFLYEYWIEEKTVGGSAVLAPDAQGRILTANGDYLVSYSGNNVATNDADNPIVVTNKYIWYKLPPTGGMGTDVIYGSGLFLVITGYIGGFVFKRRERRFK